MTTLAEIGEFLRARPHANYGVTTGSRSGVLALDVDGRAGRASLKALEAKHGPLPTTVTVLTRRGRHLLYKAPEELSFKNSAGKLGPGLDVRGEGGYVVGAGSIHPSGAPYRFVKGRALGQVELAPAPEWLLRSVAVPAERKPAAKITPIPAAQRGRAEAYAGAVRVRELERVHKAPKHQRNDTLNGCAFRFGQLVAHGLLDANEVSAELADVARQIGLDASEIGPTIKSGLKAGRANPRPLPLRGTDEPEQSPAAAPSGTSNDDLTVELARLGTTDADNGQRLVRRFGHHVRFAPGRGLLVFDGARWRPDTDLQGVRLAEQAARLIAAEAQHLEKDADRAARARFAEQSLSKGALDCMLDVARSHLVARDKDLDADPWLLNVLNGTLNLRTGELRDHDPTDLLTKMAPVEADREAQCPLFKAFLKRALGGDRELIRYVQQAIGLTLTGIITEQVFFPYGPSKTGKSTIVNLIRNMLGDYGVHTPTETLLVKQYDNNIPADLARLAGARMVTAIEANWNRQVDEARIKAMTGGEPITARFLRQNFFEFQPAFQLWFVANDFPRVRGTAGAFWERVRVIPFLTVIPRGERDRQLPEKLKAEWPGILAWAVRGCLRWQRSGLELPPAIRRATSLWKNGADHLRRFVDERLIYEAEASVQGSALYRQYLAWCTQHGEEAFSVKVLKARLPEFDLSHRRINGRSVWKGVRIRA